MKLITADREKCARCGACAEVCPMGVIQIDEEGFPEPGGNAYRLCINCGYCVDVCRHGALRHRVRKSSGDFAAAQKRYEALKKRKNMLNR